MGGRPFCSTKPRRSPETLSLLYYGETPKQQGMFLFEVFRGRGRRGAFSLIKKRVRGIGAWIGRGGFCVRFFVLVETGIGRQIHATRGGNRFCFANPRRHGRRGLLGARFSFLGKGHFFSPRGFNAPSSLERSGALPILRPADGTWRPGQQVEGTDPASGGRPFVGGGRQVARVGGFLTRHPSRGGGAGWARGRRCRGDPLARGAASSQKTAGRGEKGGRGKGAGHDRHLCSTRGRADELVPSRPVRRREGVRDDARTGGFHGEGNGAPPVRRRRGPPGWGCRGLTRPAARSSKTPGRRTTAVYRADRRAESTGYVLRAALTLELGSGALLRRRHPALGVLEGARPAEGGVPFTLAEYAIWLAGLFAKKPGPEDSAPRLCGSARHVRLCSRAEGVSSGRRSARFRARTSGSRGRTRSSANGRARDAGALREPSGAGQ